MPIRIVAWPHFPGRAELIRLYLEDLGHPYQDVAREQGVMRVYKELEDHGFDVQPFEAPIILDQQERVSHVANILAYICETYAPVDVSRYQLNGLTMTVLQLVDAVHRAHHPLDPRDDYEPYKQVAFPIAERLLGRDLDRYLTWMEEECTRVDGPWLFGETFTYADIAMAHTTLGLRHVYPRRMEHRHSLIPAVNALVDRVEERPAIQAYKASERYFPFNDFGVFRYYGELDKP